MVDWPVLICMSGWRRLIQTAKSDGIEEIKNYPYHLICYKGNIVHLSFRINFICISLRKFFFKILTKSLSPYILFIELLAQILKPFLCATFHIHNFLD